MAAIPHALYIVVLINCFTPLVESLFLQALIYQIPPLLWLSL